MQRRARKQTDPDLGMLAGQLLFSVQQELFERLAQQGHPRVRARHGAVLAYLTPEGVRATELARTSGQHKQIIGTIIDELVDLGYVRRAPDPDDRRAKLIVPTPQGLDEITKADAILADIEQRHRQALGAEAYDGLKRALQQTTRNQQAWRALQQATGKEEPGRAEPRQRGGAEGDAAPAGKHPGQDGPDEAAPAPTTPPPQG